MILFVFFSITEGCATRSSKPTPGPSALIESTASAPISAPQPAYPDSLRLDEVRVSDTNGQRNISFRFSRPPEGIDYFPLRNPSRIVIDVKGPIETLPKVQTYKASDALVSGVRIGTYQGRLRLVVDLASAEVPQFSIDNHEALVTAFVGEKNDKAGYAERTSQVLFISDETRNNHLNQERPSTEKTPTPPAGKVAPTTTTAVGTSPVSEAQVTVPVERVSSSAKSSTSSTPPSDNIQNSAQAGEALPEEKISSKSLAQSTPTKPVKPIVMAQATVSDQGGAASTGATEEDPVEVVQTEPRASTSRTGKPTHRAVREETISPSSAPDTGAAAGEFKSSSGQAYTGRRISLDFKNADVHDVLRILADVSGMNIVATDDVKARVTLRLVEIPWDQALDVVLQANGLEKSQVGNVITISTTRRLEAERDARLAAKNAQQKLAALETEYVKVNYVKATDVVALITREIQQRTSGTTGAAAGPSPALAPTSGISNPGQGGTQVALMSPRGTIAADPTTNVVIIRDVRENISAIRELIRNVDVQTPQVIIESYIVTANESLVRDLGIQWGYRYIASPETGNPTGVNFPGRIGVGGASPPLGSGTGGVPFIADFPATVGAGAGSALDLVLGSLDGSQALSLRLSALETQGKARIISRPRVVTLNNKTADIQNRRVVRVAIVSGSLSVSGTGQAAGGGNAFQEFDVGITLKVTPQISSDGFVLLDIDAESSELAPPSVRPTGVTSSFPLIPDELKRTASSNVLIKAGETFVLGGILQDNLKEDERGIPYLRDTPGLGWLFRGRTNTKIKDELLVFITPRLGVGAPVIGLPNAQQLWEQRSREAAPPAAVVQ